MTDNWAEWEGRAVDGKYLLRNYLGGADGNAVFRTRLDDEVTDAAIKLIATEDAGAERQLLRWETASELSHRNLIRILAVGHTVVDGRELFYAVEELAEENLGQIVPERPLTADEARSTLGPVVAALEYLHGKGLVHGRIRPANILAIGDQVKISSDSLREAGEVPRLASAYDAPEVAAHGVSPASDVWSLGIMLAEVMTQHLPAWDAARMKAPEVGKGIPEPICGIVRRCLEIDPQNRCGLAEIRDRLKGPPREDREAMRALALPADVEKASTGWSYWIAGIAALGVAVLLIAHPWSAEKPASKEVSVQPQTTPAQTQRSSPPPDAAASKPSAGGTTAAPRAAGAASSETDTGKAPPKDGIVLRAMPEVSPSARRTIEGRIRVRAKVDVDTDGNVTEARLTDAGPSKYFARVALEGARRWKFAPARDEGEKRQWALLFVFTRARTEAVATKAPGN
ncbi:MAG: TonB family protein [Terriglobales bacterium]